MDRLDKAALAFVAVTLAVIALVLWRGDQAGVQVTRSTPAAGAQGVATRPQLAFTFSEPMNPATMEGRFQVNPPLSGTLRWNGNTAFYTPLQPLLRDTAYTVTVRAGGQSERGRAMLRDVSISFRTGHPRILYLTPAAENGNLVIRDGADGATRALTEEPFGVFDFAASPDGRRIAYSATRDESDTRDLWLINPDGSGRERIVTCDGQICQSPSWSADGASIAFERRAIVQGAIGHSPGPARIWLYDLSAQTAAPLSTDSQQIGQLPIWAPAGNRLAYYDPSAGAVTVLDVSSGERLQLPSVLGDTGTWSPDGAQLIYAELKATDAGQYNQLLRADLVNNVITPVMPLSNSNDTSVVWSPLGTQIAFSRQRAGHRSAAGGYMPLGPQVWISTPDGRDAHALTDDPEYSYGGLAWSPDSEWIAVVRNNLRMPNPRPEVWLLRADGTARVKLSGDATIPAWLP
jgi:Tol biopolymer transport system component